MEGTAKSTCFRAGFGLSLKSQAGEMAQLVTCLPDKHHVLVSFSVAMVKHSRKSNLGSKGYSLACNSRLWPIITGKLRQSVPSTV